jgi:hypothetical protein
MMDVGCGNNAFPLLNTLEVSDGDLEVGREFVLRSRLKMEIRIPK